MNTKTWLSSFAAVLCIMSGCGSSTPNNGNPDLATSVSLCGNGKLDSSEQCDDGNDVDNDTCSNNCQTPAEPPPLPATLPAPITNLSNYCSKSVNRNGARTKPQATVRYRIHMCKDDSGREVVSQMFVRQVMQEVQDFYKQAAINLIEEQYTYFSDNNCSVRYENLQLFNANRQNTTPTGVIPIVFVRQITSTTLSYPVGGYGISGEIAVVGGINTRAVVHELGHFFGLEHTHACNLGRETVATCATSGDFICDTPPDRGPRPSNANASNSWDTCSDGKKSPGICDTMGCGIGSCDDGAMPNRDNFMSYYLTCGPSISNEQADYVRCELENSLSRFAFLTGMPAWRVVNSGTIKSLNGVWGSSANDVWAVGEGGTTLRWRGAGWNSVPSSAARTLYGAWGSSSTDVWAVGAGPTVVHWDGSSWNNAAAGTNPLYGIRGTASDQVFAVGDQHGVRRLNGGSWTDIGPSLPVVLRSIWGASATDQWAVGYTGTLGAYLTHWNGGSWSSMSAPTTGALYGIWGSNGNDIVAVGEQGAIIHFGSTGWKNEATPVSSPLFSVWGTSPKDIWAVGNFGTILHYDGTAWTKSGSIVTNNLFGIWGSGPTDIWAVGDNGTTIRYSL